MGLTSNIIFIDTLLKNGGGGRKEPHIKFSDNKARATIWIVEDELKRKAALRALEQRASRQAD